MSNRRLMLAGSRGAARAVSGSAAIRAAIVVRVAAVASKRSRSSASTRLSADSSLAPKRAPFDPEADQANEQRGRKAEAHDAQDEGHDHSQDTRVYDLQTCREATAP